MSAKLVFDVAIRAGGEIKNLRFALRERRGWVGIDVLDGHAMSYAQHRDYAEKAVRDINALIHAGIPLEALAVAARLSSSNHAEILKSAAEAVAAHARSVSSFGLPAPGVQR